MIDKQPAKKNENNEKNIWFNKYILKKDLKTLLIKIIIFRKEKIISNFTYNQ